MMAAAAAKTAGGAGQGKGAAPAMPGMSGAEDPSSKNVKEFIAGLIKHEYLNGFNLPDMPA